MEGDMRSNERTLLTEKVKYKFLTEPVVYRFSFD